MTTSEIPHHRHRYPQGDLPPLATPGKTTPQTAHHAQGAVVPRAGDDRAGGVPRRQVLSGVPTRFLFLLMTAGRGCSQPLPSHSKMRLGGWLARPEISFCRSQLRVSPKAISRAAHLARTGQRRSRSDKSRSINRTQRLLERGETTSATALSSLGASQGKLRQEFQE